MLIAGESCEFCSEFLSGVLPERYGAPGVPMERVVWRNDSAFVVASLSPISAGHLLIVPTDHVTSTAQLPGLQLREVLRLIDSAAEALIKRWESVLIFEHGVGQNGVGGCGVDHAHVHAVPVDEAVALAAMASFKEDVRGPFVEWGTLQPEDSYISLEARNLEQDLRLVAVGEFRSQYLRNLVEVASGVAPSNWRDLVRSSLMQETLGVLAK